MLELAETHISILGLDKELAAPGSVFVKCYLLKQFCEGHVKLYDILLKYLKTRGQIGPALLTWNISYGHLFVIFNQDFGFMVIIVDQSVKQVPVS